MVYALPILGKWGSGVWRADELFPDTRLRYIENDFDDLPFSDYFTDTQWLLLQCWRTRATHRLQRKYKISDDRVSNRDEINVNRHNNSLFVWIKTLKSIISREPTMILNRQIIKSKLVINANWPSRCWTELRLLADWKTNTQLSFIVIYV